MDVVGTVMAKVLTTRSLVRAPITLYRNGFGWLLGSRMLMLEHVGRTTGEPRYVCLEVVRRPSPDVVVIVSGFGERAQWYRNLRATPRCHVSIGRQRRRPANARLMDEAESAQALAAYQQEHPKAWARLRSAIEQAVQHPVEGLPMVELTLATRPS